jgi:hypothetical protein
MGRRGVHAACSPAEAAERFGSTLPSSSRHRCRDLGVLPPPERAGDERLLGGSGADIGPHHGLRVVARVPHDVALVDAGLGKGGDAAGAQAVRGDAGERRASVTGFPGPFLENQAQAFRGQRMASDRVASGDAPEYPAVLHSGRGEPGAQGGYRTMGSKRVDRDMHEGALAVLVGFGVGQEHAHPVRAEGEVGDPDADQLRATESAGEAEQEERAVAFAAQAPVAGAGDPDHIGGEQRRRPALRPPAVAAGDALQGLAQLGVVGVERQAEQGVRLGDRGEPAGQRGVGPLAGECGEVVGDQGRGGGGGRYALLPAPALPGAQVAGVGPARRGG